MNLQRMFLALCAFTSVTQAQIAPRAVLKAASALKTKLHLWKAEGDIHWLVKKWIAGIQCTKVQAFGISELCRQWRHKMHRENPAAQNSVEVHIDYHGLDRAAVLSACDMLSDSKVMDVIISNLKNADKFVRRCKAETIKRNPAAKAELEADQEFFTKTIETLEECRDCVCAEFKLMARRIRMSEGSDLDWGGLFTDLLKMFPEIESRKWAHYFDPSKQEPCQKCVTQFKVLAEVGKVSLHKLLKTAEKAFEKKTR